MDAAGARLRLNEDSNMKSWDKLKKFIGVTEEQEEQKKWRPEALPDSRPVPGPRRVRWGHGGWKWPSLRRVHRKLGPDVKLRKARAAFIRQEQEAANEIARQRREAMRKDRREGVHSHMAAFRSALRGPTGKVITSSREANSVL
jgi:hypothetical protein